MAQSRVPVRMVVGEADEYYGSAPARRAAKRLRGIYRQQGLAESDIDGLVVLDVKPTDYFAAGGVTNQYGQCGALFCRDPEIMGWLFNR